MTSNRASIAVPILIITVGVGWLLTAHNVIPGVNWLWVLGLGVVGVLILALGGIDKVTVVLGPFLVTATFLSLLRQTERITVDTEVPCLVITAGLLMLISRFLPVPPPSWLIEPPKDKK